MRFGRLLMGALLILVASWIVVGEQISGVSSNAVVNARLSTVRTPISGTLEMPWRPLGARVTQGEVLVTVTDALVDTVHLHDLELERSLAVAGSERYRRLIEDTAREIAVMQERINIYKTQRAAEIEAKLGRAKERVALLMADRPSVVVLRPEGLDEHAKVSGIDADSIALSFALQEVETLAISREAFRQGVNLGDGYDDTSATGQKLMEQSAERARLAAELALSDDRITALDVRIAAERRRDNLLAGNAMSAPTNGILWEVLAGDREVVQRGQEILKIMNCDSALVTLSVPDVVYDRLRVGQTAKFRLNQTNTIYDGTITRIAGSGAKTIYGNLAVAPSAKHLERFDVALLVPALRENTDLRCAVGQTGRVFFEHRPLDWLRKLMN